MTIEKALSDLLATADAFVVLVEHSGNDFDRPTGYVATLSKVQQAIRTASDTLSRTDLYGDDSYDPQVLRALIEEWERQCTCDAVSRVREEIGHWKMILLREVLCEEG